MKIHIGGDNLEKTHCGLDTREFIVKNRIAWSILVAQKKSSALKMAICDKCLEKEEAVMELEYKYFVEVI